MTDLIKLVSRARVRRDVAERELRAAIAAAFADRSAGHTVQDVADAAELTKQRVYQIVQEESER